MQETETEPVKRTWLYIVSPCVIAGILAMIAIIEGEIEGGWSFFGVLLGVPFLAIMVVVDFIIKSLVKHKPSKVWLFEILLISVTVLFFRLHFHYLF